jgi:hypothetical protein
MLDIPALANVAIGKINQSNPGVVRGIDSVPLSKHRQDAKDVGISRSNVPTQEIADLV